MVTLKLVRGCHRIGAKYAKREDGTLAVVEQGRNLSRGTTFESDKDLSKLFPEKFVRLDQESVEMNEQTEDIELYNSMSLDELKKLAADDFGLDVPSNIKKETLIKKIIEASNS